MKNKKSVMAVSALLILIFHLWANIFTGNVVEMFFHQCAFVGVDMFFFLSGLSLAGRKIDSYSGFIFARFKAVYVRFILLAVVAGIYSGWALPKFFKVIFGIELMQKGGGAFLWFLPAIMIFYILYPAFDRIKIGSLVLWIAVAVVGTNVIPLPQIMIFWNRLPVFVLGYYLAKIDWGKQRLIMGFVLTCAGGILMYFFAFQNRLQRPFTDMFYVVAIPYAVGIVLLSSYIPENKVISLIGSSTLEMYGIQMIFGFKLAGKILTTVGNRAIANVVTIVLICVISVLVHQAYAFIIKWFRTLHSQP